MKLIARLEDKEYPFRGIDHVREIVRCVLIDEFNRVCLQYIFDDDMFGHRDYYETPGGGVKNGEDLVTALKREIKEEVGYEIEVIAELGSVFDYYNLIKRENHNHYYLARRKKKCERHLEPDEIRRIKATIWVDIDEAIRLYTNMQNELVGKLVKQRELPILKLVKSSLQMITK